MRERPSVARPARDRRDHRSHVRFPPSRSGQSRTGSASARASRSLLIWKARPRRSPKRRRAWRVARQDAGEHGPQDHRPAHAVAGRLADVGIDDLGLAQRRQGAVAVEDVQGLPHAGLGQHVGHQTMGAASLGPVQPGSGQEPHPQGAQEVAGHDRQVVGPPGPAAQAVADARRGGSPRAGWGGRGGPASRRSGRRGRA